LINEPVIKLSGYKINETTDKLNIYFLSFPRTCLLRQEWESDVDLIDSRFIGHDKLNISGDFK
jgi:hypothetical protein